ncbi:MAG: RNA methyltransferase [Treponemataceae bacterium]
MNIVIILCRPENSQNIGSICRAMKSMAIGTLRIVGAKADYCQEDIKRLSVHAFDVWQNCQFFSSIQDASSDCTLLAGTTRRRGKKRKDWLVFPEEFAEQLNKNNYASVGILFGNEKTGLTDEELKDCTIGIQIPADKTNGSLNLSHAVQIIAYTLFQNMKVQSQGYLPVTLDQIDDGVAHIIQSLKKIGFFSLSDNDDVSRFWRGILSRSAVSQGELRYIEKLFAKCAGLHTKKNKS